jgi:transcriptional regulator with XRE-family HTH domain
MLLDSTFTRSFSSETIEGMGKAGKALKQALKTYGISQNKLAVSLGVDRAVVFHWFHEKRDPSAETVVQIAAALKGINPDAAAEFIRLYVGDFLHNENQS